MYFALTKMQDPILFLAEHKLKFTDLSLLEEALIHPSYAYEVQKISPCKDNQRLEYLGDSVLDLIINDYLFRHFPQYAEGKLTRLRSSLNLQRGLGPGSWQTRIGKIPAFRERRRKNRRERAQL